MMGELRAPDPHYMKQFAGAKDRPPHRKSDDGHQEFVPSIAINSIDKPSRHGYNSVLDTEEAVNYERSDYKPDEVPQTIEYCNSPSTPVTGSEGEVPEGYELKLVHVFIRHGDRSPILTMPGYTPPSYNCQFPDQFADNADPKIAAYLPTMEKFTGKQSKWSYFLNWSLMPNKEECGDSELTGLGALQHIQTGLHFYHKYIAKFAFFNEKIALTSQIYTRSTQISRTYQSAVAFLFGMLPPAAFNITKLTIDHSSNGYFCLPEHALKKTCYCKPMASLSDKIQNLETTASQNSNRYHDIAEKISEIFELTTAEVPSTSSLIDMFVPPICHNLTIPCAEWSDTRCMNGEIYHNLWLENNYQGHAHLTDDLFTYSKFSNIMLTPVMVEIAHRMKDQLEGRKTPKFVLYSGHDITMSPLLYILGLYDGKWTKYAARLVIEFYVSRLDEDGPHKHMLKFLYNGNDVTGAVSFCKGKLYKGMCHFKLFYEHVFTRMLQQFEFTSYEDACSRVR